MKNIIKKELIAQLQATIDQHLHIATGFLNYSDQLLNTQPAEGKWSVAQVLEHLNSYGRFYLPAIERALASARQSSNESYTPGWLGDYFTRLMAPKDAQVRNKMSAPRGHRPVPQLDAQKVVLEFISQQQQFRTLLSRTAAVDPGRIRIGISLTKLIQLKLGDTYRFLFAHQERHFLQISNTLAAIQGSDRYPAARLAV